MDAMTMPTKAQIDALVEAMPDMLQEGEPHAGGIKYYLPHHIVRRALYLAAGLNADGSEKAVRVPVLMVVNPEYPGEKHFWCPRNVPMFPHNYIITPGQFTPDGAP